MLKEARLNIFIEKNNYNIQKIQQMEIKTLKEIEELHILKPHDQLQKNEKKMYLFSNIIDFEILTDINQIYEDLSWSQTFKTLYTQNYEKQSYIEYVYAGNTHSLASNSTGKLFIWGWNDYNQLGKGKNYPQEMHFLKENIIQTGCLKNTTAVLDGEGNFQFWGENNGKIEGKEIKKFEFSNKDERIYLLSKKGELFQLKMKNLQIENIFKDQKIIKSVCCGYNFTLILCQRGLVYSKGENKYGELGQGDNLIREKICLIEFLKQEKIDQISSGFKHSACKSSLGKIFTWGLGINGQLGHGDFENQVFPKKICFNQKILQISCGLKCTILLSEGNLFWFGSNQQLKNNNFPIKYQFDKVYIYIQKIYSIQYYLLIQDSVFNQSKFQIVRIFCSWSKSISIICVTIANCGQYLQIKQNQRKKIIQLLNEQWNEFNINSINPPYIKQVSNFISEKNMKLKEI
ncbi:myosin head, putative [Ichthyophthirius multifiliis]|uniref:Myosin head, putative n=1 Tax=Ichthyophthirius multifiliis TaxID=5932 RepID=G0QK89_ICHMU|nr:myosin head, putative [Ichthyophthirius multifiliis]EGR34365.1 myosin head, putative [Ichthyophthirius multifiliis]|eukprot:XP_004039669.1 myosin head, putative [Ichthyophthirius multifiliis]